MAVTDAGRGREVLKAEDFPLRELIALAHEKEQTSATPWFRTSEEPVVRELQGERLHRCKQLG